MNRVIYFGLALFLVACQSNVSQKIEVPKEVETFILDYVQAWSDGDVEEITENVYGVPMTIYLSDNLISFQSKDEIRAFLTSTFKQLDDNGYDHSIFNEWKHFKAGEGVAIVEQSFTRYLKDGSVMGDSERTASYILKRNENGNYRIHGMIPHTEIAE